MIVMVVMRVVRLSANNSDKKREVYAIITFYALFAHKNAHRLHKQLIRYGDSAPNTHRRRFHPNGAHRIAS